jgi:hypothetical protein
MPKSRNPGLLTKNLSGQIFGAFAVDLVAHLDKGLTDAQCNANQLWLQQIATAASTLPDSGLFGKKIYQRCDAVASEYDNWNSPAGTAENRRKYHQRIKKKINKLSGAYRRRTALLEREADIAVYLAFYSATEQLVRALPDLVTTVAKTLSKFPKL